MCSLQIIHNCKYTIAFISSSCLYTCEQRIPHTACSCMKMYIYTPVDTCMHCHSHYTCAYTYIHIHTRTLAYTHAHTHIHMHIHTLAYTHASAHTYALHLSALAPFIRICPLIARRWSTGHCASDASTTGVMQLQRVLGKRFSVLLEALHVWSMVASEF